jgi:hypothetical protein
LVRVLLQGRGVWEGLVGPVVVESHVGSLVNCVG